MNIQALKDILQSEMAGRAIGLVASYCVTHKKSDAIRKFQEFSESLVSVFIKEERKELQEELDKLIEQQATMYADVFEKTYPRKELEEFIQQSDGQSS